jgi:hypothetical protein
MQLALYLRWDEKSVMRHYLTVVDVLKLYPTRKKSWAYKQLQAIRDATGRRDVLVKEFAEHVGLPEPDLRAMLSPA